MNPIERLATILCLGALALSPAARAAELSAAVLALTPAQSASGKADPSPDASALSDLNESLAREICRRLNARCVVHQTSFAEILDGVEAGRFQLGLGNFLRTPVREARVAFSQSLWRSSSRLVGTEKAIRAHRPADGAEISPRTLRKVRVAVPAGTRQHDYMKTLAASQQLTLIETSSSAESLSFLLAERADFALMPIRPAYVLLAQTPANKVDFVGPAISDHGLGGTVHIALPKSDENLRRDVDAALDAMRADGTYQRIMRRYLPFFAF